MRNGGVLILSALVLVAAPAAADPFLSAPGARARAMGGAFAALADDASAVWHNPAGLAGQRDAWSGEWAQAADLGPAEADTGANAFLVGATKTGHGSGVGAATAGLFYYTPYTMKYWVPDQSRPDTAYGRINQTIQTISLGYGLGMAGNRLKLGATADLVALDPSGTRINGRNVLNIPAPASFDSEVQSSLSGSLGLLYRAWQSAGGTHADLGLVYRHKGEAASAEPAAADALLIGRPASWDIGLAAGGPLGAGRWTSALQYGATDWGAAGDSTRTALGLEYASTGGWLPVAYRAGYYRAEPDADGAASRFWPERTGITFGLGVRAGKRLEIALGGERTRYRGAGMDSDVLQLSLSAAYFY